MGYKILATVSIFFVVVVLINAISRSSECPRPFFVALINVFLLLGQLSALVNIWN